MPKGPKNRRMSQIKTFERREKAVSIGSFMTNKDNGDTYNVNSEFSDINVGASTSTQINTESETQMSHEESVDGEGFRHSALWGYERLYESDEDDELSVNNGQRDPLGEGQESDNEHQNFQYDQKALDLDLDEHGHVYVSTRSINTPLNDSIPLNMDFDRVLQQYDNPGRSTAAMMVPVATQTEDTDALSNIEKKIDILTKEIVLMKQQLAQFRQNSNSSTSTVEAPERNEFECGSAEELTAFCQLLRTDHQIFSKFCAKISQGNKANAEKFVKESLKKVFSKELACQCNWSGRGDRGKKAVSELYVVHVIKECFVALFPMADLTIFNVACIKWFRYATDRCK